MSYGVSLSNKAGLKEEAAGMYRVMAFIFPRKQCVMSPAFLGAAEHLPPDGKQQVNSLLWLHAWLLL